MFLTPKGFLLVVTIVVTIINQSQQEEVKASSGWKLQKFSLMSVYEGMPKIIDTSSKRK